MKHLVSIIVFVFVSLNLWSAPVEPSLKFTGYKFTEKVGVSGTFKDIKWTYDKNMESVESMLKSGKIEVDTYSIDSGDPMRNSNIMESLFKNWGARKVYGKVTSVDGTKKQVNVNLMIGKASKDLTMSYVVKGSQVVIKGTLDLLEMGFKNAFMALASKCKGLHTGADGVSKTWSDVEVVITAKM